MVNRLFADAALASGCRCAKEAKVTSL